VAGVDRDRGRFEDRGLAAFGHATVTLGEVFDVGLGLRYDRESKDADLRNRFVSGGAVLAENDRNLDETYDEWLPRIELAWRPTEEFTLYAYAARGFKAGGFNLDAPDGRLAFGPETSWTYELGVKTSLFEDRFRLEAALFHIDWDDMQLSQFDASAGGYVTNAGESTSRGLEVSVAGRIADGLDLFATYGATGTEIDGYVDPYGEDTSGNDLPFSPDFTWSAGAQYTIDLDDALRLRLRAETVGIGSYHYDAGNRESERYTLTNVRVGLAGDAWRFDLWVRNLLDEEYVPVAFQPNPADPSAWIGESGAPRTLGVTFGLRF